MPTMQQPEAYIGGVDKLVDADGKFVNDSSKDYCTKFMAAFDKWIQLHQPK
jgi:chromate reductase